MDAAAKGFISNSKSLSCQSAPNSLTRTFCDKKKKDVKFLFQFSQHLSVPALTIQEEQLQQYQNNKKIV